VTTLLGNTSPPARGQDIKVNGTGCINPASMPNAEGTAEIWRLLCVLLLRDRSGVCRMVHFRTGVFY
jgi:hypothetical protein